MITSGQFTLNSSIDSSSGMVSKYVYDNSNSDMPILIMMHGFNLSIDAITSTIMQRIANQGFFVVAAGMRGRNGATGDRDASGREIFDIIDAIRYVQDNFPVSDKVAISGYSGGGGNALGAATKFPDTFNVVINHFGMSDYGYDKTYGWYYTNPSYQNNIANFVNGRPSDLPNKYLARAHVLGLTNFKGKLFNFHDADDTEVSVKQTQRTEAFLNGKGMDDEYYYSDSSDTVRYFHSMDVSAKTEPKWLPQVFNKSAWEIPDVGSLRVCGYIVTKKFSILLDEFDRNAADVEYDLGNNKFTITPLTGPMHIRINKGDKSYIYHINDVTELILDPKSITTSGDIKATFVKTGNRVARVKSAYLNESGQLNRVSL